MKILKIALGALALAALPQIAGAADVAAAKRSQPAAAYAAAPAFNWTGLYIGAHGGYAWAKATASVAGFEASGNGNSGFGGGQIGFNWQAPGSAWVFGLEGDGSFTSSDVKWVSTARVRAGIANGAWLTYATGGVAFAGTDVSVGSLSDSQTHVGWAAGAGVEWAFAPQWSAKVEYMYVGLGEETYNFGGVKINADIEAHTVKAGLNFRFGSY